MAGINSYRDLAAWDQSVALAVAVYKATASWPRQELYGLTSQARRAATSVPANIAEGYGRENTGSYVQFLKIAQGSLKELETHLIVASRIGITTEESVTPLLSQCETVGKILRGLIRSLGAP